MSRQATTLFQRVIIGLLIGSMNVTIGPGLSLAAQATDDASHARALSKAFRDAARRVMPSVVTLTVYGKAQPAEQPEAEEGTVNPPNPAIPPRPNPNPPAAPRGDVPTELGSGVIISSDGWILTNHHVVANAMKVEAETHQGLKYQVVEIHADRDSDIAVVRVQTDSPLPAAELGSSQSLEIGDWVLAIGSPFQLQASVSAGIISAKGRSLPRVRRAMLLQTDAAINPGNSGGPLIDLDGKVVGISTAIATRGGGYEGVGFAVPSDQASWIADELRAHGKVRRASLGLQVIAPNPSAGFAPGTEGAMVLHVVKDSAAEAAGLKADDLIVEIAGQAIRAPGDVRQNVERLPTDQKHPLVVIRNGERVTIEVQPRPVE